MRRRTTLTWMHGRVSECCAMLRHDATCCAKERVGLALKCDHQYGPSLDLCAAYRRMLKEEPNRPPNLGNPGQIPGGCDLLVVC